MSVLRISILLLVIHHSECKKIATAVLYGDNSMMSYGTLTFTQENANAPVHITGSLTGLNASSAHGFHVHAIPVSEGSPNCTAAGGHFNPHGPRTNNIADRHVGDLGNITTNVNGTVNLNIDDSIIQLYNATQSIINLTAIVHLSRDDAGKGGFADSHTTGNAGARILCGLIKLSQDDTTSTPIGTALNIKPTISVLFMTMIIIFMKLF